MIAVRLQTNCTLSEVMKKQEPPNTMKHPWLLKSCIYEELLQLLHSELHSLSSFLVGSASEVQKQSCAVSLFPPTLSLTVSNSIHFDTLPNSGQLHVCTCQLLACVCIEPSTTASSVVPIRTSSHCEAVAPIM